MPSLKLSGPATTHFSFPPESWTFILISPFSLAFRVYTGSVFQSNLRVYNSGESGTLIWSLTNGTSWISFSHTNGTLLPFEHQDITVDIDSTGLSAGLYQGSQVFLSSDPDMPFLEVIDSLLLELPDTHYVNIDNTTPVSPYTNQVTAATNIQEALSLALSSDKVIVSDGLYQISFPFEIDGNIILESVNGPRQTIVESDGTSRCFILNDSCVISGFTITNGNVGVDEEFPNGGGVLCNSQSNVITNCFIVGNYCTNSTFVDFTGGGVYGGTLNNCRINGNAAFNGGGADFSILNNCLIMDNSAYEEGAGVRNSEINNSIVSGNTSGLYAGGSYGSTLNNCTVNSNSALFAGGAAGSTLKNCFVIGNSVKGVAGGTYYCSTVNNCTISGNSAYYGGGTYGRTINNCTISGNSALYGGGTYDSTVNNCIIYFNPGLNDLHIFYGCGSKM